MFEEQSLQSDTVPVAATGAVRHAIITGFVFAAVYLLVAVYLQSKEDNFLAVYCLAVGLVFFLTSLVAFAGQRSIRVLDRARLAWLIGGYLGFPLGLVMVAMANRTNAAIAQATAKQESLPGSASDAASRTAASAGAPMSRNLGIIFAILVIGLPLAARLFVWQQPVDTWQLVVMGVRESAGLTLSTPEDKSYAECIVAVQNSDRSQEWRAKTAEDLTRFKAITIPWTSFKGPRPLTREIAMEGWASLDCFTRGGLLVGGSRNSGSVMWGVDPR